MSLKKLYVIFAFIIFSLIRLFADEFTYLIQDLAVQSACLGVYSSTQAGGTADEDPKDYYTPSLLAERFKAMSGTRTKTDTFYGICFDYANCAYDYIENYEETYRKYGMFQSQYWIVSARDSYSVTLGFPVEKGKGTDFWNGVELKTYDEVSVRTHDNASMHAWLWIQRKDGVWFWVDPTWTDNLGYPVYGYVSGGREVQCKPDERFIVKNDYRISSLPNPPNCGRNFYSSSYKNPTPNTSYYRNPQLIGETIEIKDKECFYWTFTVPEYADNVEIICHTNALIHNVMSYVLVDSLDEVGRFYDYFRGLKTDAYYIRGSYQSNVSGYDVSFDSLTPGKTYYFCAFKDSSLLGKSKYELEIIIQDW